MTVAVPVRQAKDIDQHLRWDSGPVFKDLERQQQETKEEDTGINS